MPTCGYTLDGYTMARMHNLGGASFPGAPVEDREEICRLLGVEYRLAEQEIVCPICGVCVQVSDDLGRAIGAGCSPEKHAAYYESFPRGKEASA